VTPEQVRANTRLAAAHDLDVVQVDDGYQAAIGDWLATNDRWREGTHAIARDIAAAGRRPGIWTAPFLAGADSALAREHPDWMVAHGTGAPLRAMYNPAWGGWAWALDTTRAEVLDHLRRTYAALAAEGWTYHKIDFCYAAALLGGRVSGRTTTRAEALRAGLEAVREGIGPDAFLVGCGCPLAQAVGVVDAMRVSPDVAPHWEPRSSWPGLAETAVAARNAVTASALRAPLHRRLWINDPDCVLLRPSATELTPEQRRQLADVVGGTGGFTVVSDDLSLYGDEEWAALNGLRSLAPSVDAPLTITDPFDPVVTVASPRHRIEVDCDEGRVSRPSSVAPT
jgi:alpha-galactosidase